MAQLTLAQLISNENARIVFAWDKVSRVTGFITSEFAVSGGATYSNLFENQALSQFSQKLQAAASIGLNIPEGGEGAFGKALSAANQALLNTNFSIGTVTQTLEFWTGSEKPTFSIPLVFVALTENSDVRDNVRSLFETVYPSFVDFGLTQTIKAPLGYLPSSGGKSAIGTVNVNIGRWFNAPQQIVKNISFHFSKETIANGTPLYAYGTVTFSPFRMISIQQMKSYLTGTTK